jgi:hypothetical protein
MMATQTRSADLEHEVSLDLQQLTWDPGADLDAPPFTPALRISLEGALDRALLADRFDHTPIEALDTLAA